MSISSSYTDLGEEHLRPLCRRLIEVAASDRPPIDVVLQTYPPTPSETNIGDLVTRIEAHLTPLLCSLGFAPCRRVSGLIAGFKEPAAKTIFVRPAEMTLLDALDDSHPVVLATTFETQRFVDALVERCNRRDAPRELWIWRGASGRMELERLDRAKRPEWRFGVGQTSRVIRDSDLESDAEDVITALREKAQLSGGRVASSFHKGAELTYWWTLVPGEDASVELMIDDHSAGLEDCPESLQRAISAEVARSIESSPQSFDFTVTQQAHGFSHALALLSRMPPDSVLIVPDAHHFLSFDPSSPNGSSALLHISALKEAYHRLERSAGGRKLILLSGELTLPKDLREEVLRVDLPLPNRGELFVAIRATLPEAALDDELAVKLGEEAAGMTLAEVKAELRRLTDRNEFTSFDELLSALRVAKRRHIARSPALELIQTATAAELGGMDRFKEWLELRHRAFTDGEGAKRAGINRAPRGVLLLGIPGSGKSLAAKEIARDWQLPLVRLDMGALHHMWVGSSEARVREALKVVEAMAPCVLWIDEIDKGIAQGAGNYANSSDLNIRATLLTWMQESSLSVFIVATCNRFVALPPELTRAGRFDARFFFGCPGPKGRERILSIHLRDRGFNPADFAVADLVEKTHGFTGAEIEQVILDALYESFHRGDSPSDALLLRRATETKPIITSAGQGLDDLWDLVENGRVAMASGEMLTRAQVARLIDPHLYRPIYCRLDAIEGFEKHKLRAERFLMRSPYGGPAAVVLETGEPKWVYVQTNFTRSPGDLGCFKFLDELDAIKQSFVLDTLVGEHALECVYFETESLRETFEQDPTLSAYSELFKLA